MIKKVPFIEKEGDGTRSCITIFSSMEQAVTNSLEYRDDHSSLTPVQTPAKLPVSLMTVLVGTGIAECTVAMMRRRIFGF